MKKVLSMQLSPRICRVVTLVIFAIFPCAIFAQSALGIRFQPAISNLQGISYSCFGGRLGPEFTWDFSEKWDLVVGIGYFSSANRTQSTTFGDGHDITVTTAWDRLHAIDLEALPKFHINDRFRISAGPYLAMPVYGGRRVNFVFTDNGVETKNSIRGNNTALYNQPDFGVRVNLAYRLSEKADLHLMFSQGLRQLSVLHPLTGMSIRPQLFGLGIDWHLIRFD